MSYDAIGRRYARAIFEIGKEEGKPAALSQQLSAFADAYRSSTELQNVLENPLVPDESRAAIVTDIAQRLAASETTIRALRVITKQRRLRAVPDIARHLSRLVDEDAKVVRAEVMSAKALSPSYLERLKAELERVTGKKVELSSSVDPSLLGGVVTRIGDRVIDGSLKTRLRSFRDATLPN